MIKLLAVCLVTAVLIAVLTQYKSEYGILLSAAAGGFILIYVLSSVLPTLRELCDHLERAGIDSDSMAIVMKTLGIAYLTEFSADTCRDFGQTALAAKAELVGKCTILLLTVPLLYRVLETALQVANL